MRAPFAVRWRYVVLLLFLGSLAPAVARPALSCPPGTGPRTGSMPQAADTVETCMNERSGLAEGPARVLRPNGTRAEEFAYVHGKRQGMHRRYDESGTIVLVESMYSDGKLVSESVTLAGLGAIVAYANEQERKNGSDWRLSVIDLHRIRYSTKVGLFGSLLLGSRDNLRQQAARQMCPVMAARGTDVRSVDVQYVDGDGDVVQEFTIRREECAADAKAR